MILEKPEEDKDQTPIEDYLKARPYLMGSERERRKLIKLQLEYNNRRCKKVD